MKLLTQSQNLRIFAPSMNLRGVFFTGSADVFVNPEIQRLRGLRGIFARSLAGAPAFLSAFNPCVRWLNFLIVPLIGDL